MQRPSLFVLWSSLFLAFQPQAEAPAKALWSGKVGAYRIEVSETQIQQIQPVKRTLLPLLQSMGDDEMFCEAERQVGLKSWVGTLVSYQQSDDWNCIATAHPGAYTQVKTLNLVTHKSLKLTDIFPDKQVLKALLTDSLVKKHLPTKAPHFSSSQHLIDYLVEKGTGECAYTFGEESLSEFYFHHLKGNQVAVRMGLSHGCEAARGMLTEIGFYLPLPQAWQNSFQQAAQGKAGFLAQNNPLGTRKVQQQVKDPGYDAALKAFMSEHSEL